ncbi:hypothetical protein M747DRAFT_92218 [Aspergillus niger ATCC 13496]|uniref:Secreted protein n=1 Tax=Aspergillus niger ATCC 13496 TaxID=1353008 RepID=A0A370CES1_ASPNG|nr:hypothetical protein M747DRAFT_92218 [Aspergillus niger ATCC 13496]
MAAVLRVSCLFLHLILYYKIVDWSGEMTPTYVRLLCMIHDPHPSHILGQTDACFNFTHCMRLVIPAPLQSQVTSFLSQSFVPLLLRPIPIERAVKIQSLEHGGNASLRPTAK